MSPGRVGLAEQGCASTPHGWFCEQVDDLAGFLSRISEQLAGHDDREQHKTGLDVILAGIATL